MAGYITSALNAQIAGTALPFATIELATGRIIGMTRYMNIDTGSRRVEIGGMLRAIRPIAFGDLGWVGDRTRIADVGRPMSGVGVGASVLDGLIRADLARGLYPQRRLRLDMYVEAKF